MCINYSLDVQHVTDNLYDVQDVIETSYRSSPSEVLLGKGILKICSKFIGEQPCRSVISIKLQSNVIEITLRHRCSPVNLLHIFRTPCPNNTSEGVLLAVRISIQVVYSLTGFMHDLHRYQIHLLHPNPLVP